MTQLQCARNSTHVWLHTHLDVDWGLDASDRDYIQTYLTPLLQGIIQAMRLYPLLSRC